MITQARLKELLHYDPSTGVFTWLVQQGRAVKGEIAGTIDKGYVRIKIDGKKYRGHRLAWLYVMGSLPSNQIDHKNGVRSYNAWENLREADGVGQNANKNLQRNNKSGIRGVSKFRDKWRAVIYIGKKQKLLGYFQTKEEAAHVYTQAATMQFGNFMRL